MGAVVWTMIICIVLVTTEADNGFPQIGRCNSIEPFSNVDRKDYEGIWFLQYRRKQYDFIRTHTCYADYEKEIDNKLHTHTFMYRFTNGKPVKKPVRILYDVHGGGKYLKEITTDEFGTFTIYWQVLYADGNSRITYLCTDHPESDPNLLEMYIWSSKQNPSKEKIQALIQKVKQRGLKIEFDKVEQGPDKCQIYAVQNPLQLIADNYN